MSHSSDIKALKRILTEAGLGDNEALVYLSLLRLGQSGTSSIARESGLHGQLVYRALDSLLRDGFVEKTTVNRRARYIARSPKRILDHLDTTRNKLSDAVSTLELLHTPALTDQVFITQGEQQFAQTELERIKATPKDSELLIISGIDDTYWETMGTKMNEHDYIRQQRNISVRYVGSEKQREMFRQMDLVKFEYRLLPYDFYGKVNAAVFPNAFSLYIFTDPPTSLYLENPNIAESYRSFFEALWKIGK